MAFFAVSRCKAGRQKGSAGLARTRERTGEQKKKRTNEHAYLALGEIVVDTQTRKKKSAEKRSTKAQRARTHERTKKGATPQKRAAKRTPKQRPGCDAHTYVRTYTHTHGHDTFGAPKWGFLMRVFALKGAQKRHFASTHFMRTFPKPGRHLDLRFGSRAPKCGILRAIYVATSGREGPI